MNRVVTRLGFTTLALVAGSVPAFAQSSTTGGLAGVIRDTNGAPVAGAAIRLTSPQTTRTVITGSDGSYRFGLLNPGAWQVRITKEGFQAVNATVTIQTNKEDQFNAKLASAASATVEVTAAVTAVDNTTTQTGLAVSAETISAVPKGRDMSSITFLAPGVSGGGFGGTDPSIGGGSAAENSYIVDGLTTTNYARGFQGAALVTDFIDQVEVQTGGFKPEFSALGGVVNAVTKSGTNQFQGSAWMNVDARSLQAKPKKSQFFRQADPADRYDVGFSAGGAIIKDKLFYFAGANLTKTTNKAGTNAANQTGQVNSDSNTDALQLLAKINWYVSPDHQLTFSANVNDAKTKQDKAFTTYGDSNIGGETKSKQTNLSLNWDWTITPSLFLSAKLGQAKSTFSFMPVNTADVQVVDNSWYQIGPGRVGGPALRPASVDQIVHDTGVAPAYVHGGSGGINPHDDNTTTQARADLSWFLGNHNLKVGISQLDTEYTSQTGASGPQVANPFFGQNSGPAVLDGVFATIRTNGRLQELFNGRHATVKATFRAFYAQDSWEIMSGLRAFYGFRYETQEQKDSAGKTFMKYDDVKDQLQPRVGFTWDVNNDGKSKLSGSYARYFENVPQRLAIRVFANEYFLRFRYSAADTHYNVNTGAYALTPGARFVNFTQLIDFGTPFNNDPIADNTKLPHRDEYSLGYDQTLGNGWTAGVHAKYRKLKDPIEDMVFTDRDGNLYDEGPDIGLGFGVGAAVLGNPGRYQRWTPNKLSLSSGHGNINGGKQFAVGDLPYDDAGNTYASVDLTLEHKTERSYLNFSYTWSRLEGNYEGVVSSSNGQADGNITASFDYYPYVGYGLLPLDRTHVAKLYGSYRFDVKGNDLNLGFNWTYQSGTPISNWDNTNDIGGYGNATPIDGQLGQFGRNPATNNVDLRLDYNMKLGGGKFKLTPSLDVFNLFNTRTPLGSIEQRTDGNGDPNEQFGAANAWQVGRRYRFGLKLTF